jgi:hypothetical protein
MSRRNPSFLQSDLFSLPPEDGEAAPEVTEEADAEVAHEPAPSPLEDLDYLPANAAPGAGPLVRVARPVPGVDGAEVVLELDAEQQIWVERPRAWAGFRVLGPARYLWEGGVPSPDSPGVPGDGAYQRTDIAHRDPVLAAIMATDSRNRASADQKRDAKAVWAEMWREVAPHLNPDLARFVADFDHPASLYYLLNKRVDLADYLEVCPALAPFFSVERVAEVPQSGWALGRVAEHLVSPDPNNPESYGPGFMVWAREMNWDKERIPALPRSGGERLRAMKGLVRGAVAIQEQIDPNGVYKVETDDEWLVLNTALLTERTRRFVPLVLNAPSVAVKRIMDHYPPGINVITLAGGEMVKLDRRGKVTRVLEVYEEYRANNPEEAAKVDGFGGLAKKAKKWDRETHQAEVKQEEVYYEEVLRKEEEKRLEEERLAEEQRRLEEERLRKLSEQQLLEEIKKLETLTPEEFEKEMEQAEGRRKYWVNYSVNDEQADKKYNAAVAKGPAAVKKFMEERRKAYTIYWDKRLAEDTKEFPNLIPPEERVYEEGKYSLRLLSTPRELLVTAQENAFCLGSSNYKLQCEQGKVYIFVMRNIGDDESALPVATVETTGRALGVCQALGPFHLTLDKEKDKWIQEAMKEMRKRFRAHRERLAEELRARLQGGRQVQ